MKAKHLIFCLGLLLLSSHVAWADAGTKFARGLSNTTFGWFEIVNEIGHESDRHGPFIGFPSGLIRGVAFGIVRTATGILEVITFPWPNGKRGYEPLILPESVFARR